ncbi:MAG: phosphoribosylglycinamide formyltransferase [Bacteroidales bacterium]|nr:phosphoribosylglycinamide formyltransferase [Bacteroidales bacterium]
MTKIIIFISGRGSNMEAILKEIQNGILTGIAETVLVFSDKKDAIGLQTAKTYGIKTASISAKGKNRKAFDNEVIDLLENYNFDYIVLAGYMRILSENFVKTYKNKIINIHPADTNLHQGLHAYDWAFENKMQKTKITVHYVNEGVDTGKIIAQKEVDLKGANTLEEVEKRGLAVEHSFYSETLRNIFQKTFQHPQDLKTSGR